MTESFERRWLYVRREEVERLYRVRCSRAGGELCLPEGDRLQIEVGSDHRFTLTLRPEAEQWATYEEGEVLRQPQDGSGPRRLRSVSMIRLFQSLLGIATFAIACVLLWKGGRVEAAKKEITLQPVQHMPTVAGKTDEEKPKRVVPSSNQKETPPQNAEVHSPIRPGVEAALRAHLIRGDLTGAAQVVDEIERRHAKLTEPILRLASEVWYAKCRSARARNEIAEALSFCERALVYRVHVGARQLLQEFEKEGRRLYLEGYVMERHHWEAARQRYEEAARLSPRRSPYRKKALQKLKTKGNFLPD